MTGALRSLTVVQDDLLFASRVQAHARRLGIPARLAPPSEVEAAPVDPDGVIVLQITLHSERQLALLQRLLSRRPQPTVLAVTGHLEVDLRRRARRMGAALATNSALERALAKACGTSVGPGRIRTR